MNNGGYPEPIVGAFIVKDNKLLLIKSHKWNNMWVVPGGHIELGETIEGALKRETKEETNLEITNPEFICLWEFINESEFHEKRHMIFLNYRVEAVSEDVKLNDEGQDYVWASQEEVMKLPMEKYTKLTLEKYSQEIFK